MMTRWAMAVAGLLALGACEPAPLADSASDPMGGVGFGDYEEYLARQQARDAQLAGLAPSSPEATGAPSAAGAGVPTAADLAAAGIGVSTAVRRPDAPATATATAANTAPLPAPSQAPSQIRSPIQSASASTSASAPLGGSALAAPGVGVSPITPAGSEAAAASPVSPAAPSPQATPPAGQRGVAYTPVPPASSVATAGPRSQASGTDIVAFALNTSNEVGEARYRRVLASEGRAERQCRRYAGADLAQRAFLEAGGPQRDRLGLDPDGDGFACGWSPAPFRAARG